MYIYKLCKNEHIFFLVFHCMLLLDGIFKPSGEYNTFSKIFRKIIVIYFCNIYTRTHPEEHSLYIVKIYIFKHVAY